MWAGGEKPKEQKSKEQKKLDNELLEAAFDGELDVVTRPGRGLPPGRAEHSTWDFERLETRKYKEKYLKIEDNLAQLEKQVMLQILDVHWKDHLSEMDHLRQSVGLRAYAQMNPKNEYTREAFEMFEVM